MNWHAISIPLVIIGFIVYTISLKSIPQDIDPLVALASAYFIAFVSCTTLLILGGGLKGWALLFKDQRWGPVLTLGFSLIVIELGFLYAYRTGWKISTASIIAGSFTTISLAFIGFLWYKEEITPSSVAGIILCTIGVVLLNFNR